MMGFTDLHCHALWGVDDGPDAAAGMHEMVHAAAKQGISRLALTPHAYPGLHPFDRPLYEQRLQEARDYCRESGLDITLLSGAEIAWTHYAVEALRQGQLPTLNQGDHVLIELWPDVSFFEMQNISEKLLRAGYTPIFAHVERYRCFLWQPGKAVRIKEDLPVLYQLNASSLLAGGGPVFRHFMKQMLSAEGIDLVASDAHDIQYRPPRMLDAYQALKMRCRAEYVEKLVHFDGV